MRIRKKEEIDLSIVMPCLNEEKTVGKCIDEALGFISANGLCGEVIVVDNGSTDDSAGISARHGAVVIKETRRGYGRALRTGFAETRGRIVIMADCDTTYELNDLSGIYKRLSSGRYDMVIGDRFAGGIERNAMPLSHKIGARALSFIAGKVYKGFSLRTQGLYQKGTYEDEAQDYRYGICHGNGCRGGEEGTKDWAAAGASQKVQV